MSAPDGGEDQSYALGSCLRASRGAALGMARALTHDVARRACDNRPDDDGGSGSVRVRAV